MKHISDVLGGIGILIAIYLFLSNGKQTTNIISSLLTNGTNAIKVLQGRG